MKELILIGVFVLSFILNLFNISGIAVILILSGGTLSLVYFALSILLLNKVPMNQAFNKEFYKGISTLRIVGSLCVGIALSVFVIGCLFVIMYWPGGKEQLVTGTVLCVLLMGFAVYKYLTGKDIFYRNLMRRLSLAMIAGLLLLSLPQYFLLDIKYKNHPAFLEALKYSMEHPEDAAAHQKYVDEAKKMHAGE